MWHWHHQRLSSVLFLLTGFLAAAYLYFFLGPAIISCYDVYSQSSAMFSLCVIIDPTSLSFSAVVAFIASCVFMFSRYYMASDIYYYRFMWILLSFVISMQLLIFANSLFMLLMGWDGLGISSFALIMYYQSSESRSASFLTLMVNRVGDTLIMCSMFAIALSGTTLLSHLSPLTLFSVLSLYLVAAMTKSAQYPFSAWLPAAMAAPTPVSALVHSSTLVTAGVYLLVRMCLSHDMSLDLCSLLLLVGSVTSLIGGVCAVYENDLKKLIAQSTLSQLGVMVFSLGLGMHSLALLHLFTHAMFKALLFLAAGAVLLISGGVQDMRLMGSITMKNPLLLVFMNVSALSLAGFPFLSAYYSKHAILTYMWMSNINLLAVVLMVASMFLSSVYMFRMLKILNWGTRGTNVITMPSGELTFYAPLVLLMFGSCFVGWMLTTLSDQFEMASYTPAYLSYALLLIPLVGVVVGSFSSKSSGSSLCSTMFYMVPVSNTLVGLIMPRLLPNIFCLEKGWLEPPMYMSTAMLFMRQCSMMSLWPLKSLHIGSFFMVAGILMAWCWYFLT